MTGDKPPHPDRTPPGQAPSGRDASDGDAASLSASLRTLLEAAGTEYRRTLDQRVPPALGLRVRAALARDVDMEDVDMEDVDMEDVDMEDVDREDVDREAGAARGRYSRWYVAAAAVALLALGASLWSRPSDHAEAMPPEILTAAELARLTVDAEAYLEQPGTCAGAGATSPVHFPPVKDGSLRILRCEEKGDGTTARLFRPEDLPSVGYVAVQEPGARAGPTIGMTDLGDLVVYDLAFGNTRHYLAVSHAFLDRERARTPGRESCRACHNLSRVGQANPHHIVARSWGPGG